MRSPLGCALLLGMVACCCAADSRHEATGRAPTGASLPASGVSSAVLSLALALPEPIRDAFARFDKNGDGRLSPDEWRPLVLNPDDAPIDLDGDGFISPEEFARSFVTVNSRRPPNEGLLAQRYTTQARTQLEAGELAAAEATLRTAVRDFPSWATCWTLLGDMLRKSGRASEARKAYLRAIELSPNGQMAWLRLAMTDQALGRTSEVAGELAKGLKLLELRLAVYGSGAKRQRELGHAEGEVLGLSSFFTLEAALPAKSMEILDSARTFLGARPRLEAARIWTRALLGRSHPLDEVDEALRKMGRDPELLAVRGRLLRREGKEAEAAGAFREAIAAGAGGPESRTGLLELFVTLRSAGPSPAASRTLETLIAVSNTPGELAELVRAQLLAGGWSAACALLARLEPNGTRRAALDDFERALLGGDLVRARELQREAPLPDPDRCLGLLSAMRERGLPVAAQLACLNEALLRASRSERLWLEKVRLLESSGRDLEAVEAVDHALALDPASAELHLARGRLLSRSSGPREALASLERARELGTDPVRLEGLEACVLLDLGRRKEALAKLEALGGMKVPGADLELVANGLSARREYAEAKRWVEAAIRAGRSSSHVKLLLAQAELASGQRERGLADLEALARSQTPIEPGDLLLIAGLFSGAGRWAESIPYQRAGVAAHPDNAFARVTLAELLTQAGRRPEALKALDEGLRASRLDASARAVLSEARRKISGN